MWRNRKHGLESVHLTLSGTYDSSSETTTVLLDMRLVCLCGRSTERHSRSECGSGEEVRLLAEALMSAACLQLGLPRNVAQLPGCFSDWSLN